VLVCHCKAVTDGDILAAIAAGAVDEFDVAAACGAGTGCGGCVPAVTALLARIGCAPGCPVIGALRGRHLAACSSSAGGTLAAHAPHAHEP
jgi:bacterioferritin-associated ferredoxin